MITTSNRQANPALFNPAVDGMSRGRCVQAAVRARDAVPGVAARSAAVGSAPIAASLGLSISRARAALDQAGYPARAGDSPPGGAGQRPPSRSSRS